MANVISQADYSSIATSYANARDKAVSAVGYLFDAVYTIVLLQDLLPEVDLLQEFYNSYLINNDLLKSPVNFMPAVRSLNNHVLNRSSYSDIDTYLDAASQTIPQTWADLSASAGFVITEITP